MAKEGDTVEPGTKIAVISKSGEGVTQAPSEKAAAAHPPPPEQKESAEKQIPKAETAPIKEKIKEPSPSQPKAKGPSPAPKHTASEPQLPPKDRERRVSLRVSSSWKKNTSLYLCYVFSSSGKEILEYYLVLSCLGSYDKTQETGCNTLERFSEYICFAEHI